VMAGPAPMVGGGAASAPENDSTDSTPSPRTHGFGTMALRATTRPQDQSQTTPSTVQNGRDPVGEQQAGDSVAAIPWTRRKSKVNSERHSTHRSVGGVVEAKYPPR
jgi:hypothetical protein